MFRVRKCRSRKNKTGRNVTEDVKRMRRLWRDPRVVVVVAHTLLVTGFVVAHNPYQVLMCDVWFDFYAIWVWDYVGGALFQLFGVTDPFRVLGDSFELWLCLTFVGGLQWFLVAAFFMWLPRLNTSDPNCCAKCSYNLTGNVSGVCPECGTPIERAPGGDPNDGAA